MRVVNPYIQKFCIYFCLHCVPKKFQKACRFIQVVKPCIAFDLFGFWRKKICGKKICNVEWLGQENKITFNVVLKCFLHGITKKLFWPINGCEWETSQSAKKSFEKRWPLVGCSTVSHVSVEIKELSFLTTVAKIHHGWKRKKKLCEKKWKVNPLSWIENAMKLSESVHGLRICARNSELKKRTTT